MDLPRKPGKTPYGNQIRKLAPNGYFTKDKVGEYFSGAEVGNWGTINDNTISV